MSGREDTGAPGGYAIRLGIAITLLLLAVAAIAIPVMARSPTVKDIQPGDGIFLYERDLNLTSLSGGGGPIRSLVHYSDFSDKVLDNIISVGDEESFEVLDVEVDGIYGIYYAWNDSGLILDEKGSPKYYVNIAEPGLSLDVVLANPYHVDSVEGLSISRNTLVAFEVTAPKVGSWYRVGDTCPAQVDIVMMRPGGSELASFGGRDMRGLNVSSTQFYTDDPGRPGAITLADLEAGDYSFQARWSAPEEFAGYAADSNAINFTVRGSQGVTLTVSPTHIPTKVPTLTPIIPATTLPIETETVVTSPVSPTETPGESPVSTTYAPLSPLPIITGIGVAILLAARQRG